MPVDIIGTRLRVVVNPQIPGIDADIHAAKNDTVGRLVLQMNSFGTSVNGPYIAVGHARGVVDAPTNNVAEDNLGDFEFYAYAGGWRQAAEVRAFVSGAVADGVTPNTRMEFKVTDTGALSVRATLFSYGRFALGSGSRASVADMSANGAGTLWVAENTNDTAIAAQYSGTNANAVIYLGRKSRGASMAAPTAVVLNDNLVIFRPGAYTGTWFDDAGFLRFAVDDAVVANQRPATRFEVYTNLNNATPVVALRVLSGGTVVVGASAGDTSRTLHVLAGTSGVSIARIQSTGGGATNHVLRLDGGDNAITGSKFNVFHRPDGTEIGSVSQNAAATVAYNTSSDVRLKDNVRDLDEGLKLVMSIRPRRFHFKTDASKQDMTGFIAQELHEVLPEAVSIGGGLDCECRIGEEDSEGKVCEAHGEACCHVSPWGVDYGKLTPVLVRAIQEIANRLAILDGR